MAKQYRRAACLAALLLPAAAGAQEKEVGEWTDGPATWVVEEHPLVVAPTGTKQGPEVSSGAVPKQPETDWPSEQLRHDWDVSEPFTFIGVDPAVSARFDTAVGDTNDATNIFTNAELNLYFLELNIPIVQSAGGDRNQLATMTADLRIPFSFGPNKFAIIPGVGFSIDPDVDKNSNNTNVHVQGSYGFGAGSIGLQLAGGVTDGPRNAGLLEVGETLTGTGATFGGLFAIRPIPFLQLRAEVSGDIATESGQRDRLTLMPGAVFFPWSDPRLGLGLNAVIEDVEDGLDFNDPAFGGLVNLGFYFM